MTEVTTYDGSEPLIPSDSPTLPTSGATNAIWDSSAIPTPEESSQGDLEDLELQEYFYAAVYGGVKIHGFANFVQSLTFRGDAQRFCTDTILSNCHL